MQILPAVLEKDGKSFTRQIKNLSHYFQTFQVDVSDGKFTKNKTAQIDEITESIYKEKLNIKHLTFDFHLMVYNYREEIEKIKKLSKLVNVGYILIHKATNPSLDYLTSSRNFSSGLVLDIKDKVDDLPKKYNLDLVPIIQIMTVNIGYQGTPFMAKMLEKIDDLKELGYKNKIYLDGGINNQTIPLILNRKYRPDGLGIGSFLTRNENIKQTVSYLKSL